MRNTKKVRETTATKKSITIPFSITWPKKGESLKPQLTTTNVLISGILITCIILSLVSGFIDLVFFSGLSVSYYPLFGLWQIPAGVLFTLMSLGFISAKFWCAMQLGAIGELQNRLKNDGYSWYKKLNRIKWKWHAAHKFLIAVSLITSISLSVISIGTGLATKAGWLDTIKTYQDRGEDLIKKYDMIGNTTLQSTFNKASQGNNVEKDADAQAEAQTAIVWEAVQEWQNEYNSVTYNTNSREPLEELGGKTPFQYWTEKNGRLRTLLSQNDYTGATSEAQLARLGRSAIKNNIRQNLLNSGSVDTKRSDAAVEQLQSTKDEVVLQMTALLEELNSAKLEIPGVDETGKRTKAIAVFDISDNAYVSLNTALQQLSQYYKLWEADEGDTGASSKIFTQIAALFKAKGSAAVETIDNYDANTNVSVNNMKTEEVMIMLVIMVFGIVQEFLIALFTPKSTIDRKMLSRFDNYFGEDFNIDMFLLGVYKDYLKKGIISQKDFEIKARKCVELMEDTVDDVIARYSKKAKLQKRNEKEEQDRLEELKKYYEAKLADEKAFTKYVQGLDAAKTETQTPIEPAPKIEVPYNREFSIDEIDAGIEAATKAIQQTEPEIKHITIEGKLDLPPKVDSTPVSQRMEDLKEQVQVANQRSEELAEVKDSIIKQEGYSEAVDKAVNEIEELLKD